MVTPSENSTKTGSVEAVHPGPINNEEQVQKLQIENEPWLKHSADSVQMRTSCKEDQDILLLPDLAWKYLHDVYGGTDIPRYSIEAASEDDNNDGNSDKQFIVEVFY